VDVPRDFASAKMRKKKREAKVESNRESTLYDHLLDDDL
jgi:hypothetical protein